jgi:hypothetical protein
MLLAIWKGEVARIDLHVLNCAYMFKPLSKCANLLLHFFFVQCTWIVVVGIGDNTGMPTKRKYQDFRFVVIVE